MRSVDTSIPKRPQMQHNFGAFWLTNEGRQWRTAVGPPKIGPQMIWGDSRQKGACCAEGRKCKPSGLRAPCMKVLAKKRVTPREGNG